MSLYEQFHSDINKKFMFDILKDELLKSTSTDISIDSSNYDYFLTFFPKVFSENNSDEIETLNKILLDQSIIHFTEKLNQSAVVNDYEKLLQERNNIYNQEKDDHTSDNIEMDDIIPPKSLTKNEKKVLPYTEINEISNQKELTTPNQHTLEEVKLKPFSLSSSKRSNINSSRYYYRINIKNHSIHAKNIKKISKLILPIEDNYIFDIPVISLSIPELNYKVHMQQEKTIQSKIKPCGVYTPIIDNNITDINTDIDKITIDIRDITETKFPSNDILKINIIEIKENTIEFTCSNIQKINFKVNDNIKVINIQNQNKLESILNDPFKIKKINKNIITCKINDDHEKGTFNDIDMKIINMSNQNIIYFN